MSHKEKAIVPAAKPQLPVAVEVPLAPSTVEQSDRDELFPVARLIQAMSKQESCQNPNGPDFVKGDVVVYPKREKIADYKHPFSVIFLRNTLEWANFEIVGAKEEWRSEERRSDKPFIGDDKLEHEGNEHWPFEFEVDGKKMKRYRQITLYVLIPEQAQALLDDAVSENPTGVGSVTPVAIKTRNYSYKCAQEIIDKVAGKDIQTMNALRASKGMSQIPVYAYEHIIQPMDKDNKKGIFQILAYKGSKGVRTPEIRMIAEGLHKAIASKTKLETVQMEETQSTASRGEVSEMC